MKKQIRLLTAAVVLLLAAAAATAAVYAYLQSKNVQPNVFEIAEGGVEVTETFTAPQYLKQENIVQKVVTVQNTGTSDQYVRVYLNFSDSTVRDRTKLVYASSDGRSHTWEEFLYELSHPAENPPVGWVYVPEDAIPDGRLLGGYFYYTEILAPGASTPPLIEGIETTFDEDDPDQITEFNVIVYTEGVQTVEIAMGEVYGPATAEAPTPWKTAWRSFLDRS